MLLEIKQYLIAKKTANLHEICLHFCKQPETVRCILTHWLRKGKVCRLEKPNGCQTRCQLCRPEYTEIYQWMEDVPS